MSRPLIFLLTLAAVVGFAIGCGGSTTSPDPESSVRTDSASPESGGLPEQSEPPVSASVDPPMVTAPVPVEPQEETAFDRLCKAYVSGDGDGWAAAEKELLEAGHDATPALVAALKDGAEHERELAASMLAQTGAISPQAKAALTAALDDESTFVRANAVAALCATGDSSPGLMKVINELLAREDTDSRLMAVVSIGNLGEKAESFVPALTRMLDDAEEKLRQAAVTTLGRIGPTGESAIEKLESIAADDPSPETRQSAATAIALIRGEESKGADPTTGQASGTPVIPASSSQEVGK